MDFSLGCGEGQAGELDSKGSYKYPYRKSVDNVRRLFEKGLFSVSIILDLQLLARNRTRHSRRSICKMMIAKLLG